MADLTPDLVRIVSVSEKDRTIIDEWLDPGKYMVYYSRNALLHFPDISSEYAHREIYGIRLYLYFAGGQWADDPTGNAFVYYLEEPFGEDVTYNTKPDFEYSVLEITPDYMIQGYYWSDYIKFSDNKAEAQRFLQYYKNGFYILTSRNFSTSLTSNPPTLTISLSSQDVYPTVSGSPSGGYLPKQADNTFTWTEASMQNKYTFLSWDIAGRAFEWKNAGDAEWTHVDANSGTYTLPANTITGSSIVWRGVVTLSDGSRTETVYSPEYTINTTEPLGYATPLSPISTIMDGTKQIRLSWRYSNDSGRLQNGADIQWGVPNSTYQDLGNTTGNDRTYTVPADFFPAGTIYWRVRSYNQDGAVGPWSSGVTFVNIAAPPAPVLTSDNVPYATIHWQSEGQEAWRLSVDGTDYGVRYGYDRSFTLPEPLEDGQHTASVTVQNEFGLWSQPGALVFDILNQPGGEVMLSGEFGVDAALRWTVSPLEASPSPVSDWARGGMSSATGANQSNGRRLRTAATTGLPSNVRGIRAAEGYEFVLYCWDGNGEYLGQWTGEGFEKSAQSWTNSEFLDPVYNAGASAIRILARRTDNADITTAEGVNISYLVPVTREPEGFQVYRDGVRIGRTSAREFVDRMALGEHSWQVLARLPDGYYTRSNTVTGTVSVREPVIAAANGSGEWLRLRLSDRSTTVQDFSSERTVSLRHFAGAEYPVLEMAPFKDRSGRYDVSFLDPAEAAAFEALFGQVVILKSRRGNVIVGPLASLGKAESDFYTSFTFTIQQIHWEENADDS